MSVRTVFPALLRFLHSLENASLVILLTLTIFLAVLQILLRNVFETGLPWADTLLRILVLWLGLAGAMIASREQRHIRIDILSRYLDPASNRLISRFLSIVAAIVCGIIAWYSVPFVKMEFEDGLMAFAGVPVWIAEAIIPFAFTVMTLRYIGNAILPPEAPAD